MKTITCLAGVGLLAVLFSCAYAQQAIQDKYSPIIEWTSKNSTDPITIQNGTAVSLYVTITVSGNNTGINLKNCGSTTHVDPGSTAVCYTKDPVNQVSFSSDKVASPASGTYSIRQQF